MKEAVGPEIEQCKEACGLETPGQLTGLPADAKDKSMGLFEHGTSRPWGGLAHASAAYPCHSKSQRIDFLKDIIAILRVVYATT